VSGTERYGFEDDPQATSVVEALHRFSWDFGKLDVGLSGHIMYARSNNRFYLSDFFPVISWHQAEVLETNLSMILDAQYEPFDGLRFMAQGGFDDISADFAGYSDDATPTIPACVLAARYDGELGGGAFGAYLEAGYTHWLWGNYDGSVMAPNTVDPLMRAQYRMLMVSGAALLPLTSPYGPGARWLASSCAWETPLRGLQVGLDLLVLEKNVDANLISTKYIGNTATPNARTVLFSSVSLPATFRWKSLAASAEVAACAKDGRWWLESTFMLGYRFRNSLPVSRGAD
jgi:hypothetical protein